MYVFWIILLFIPLTIFFPTRLIGRKNLKKVKGKKIITANHRSNLDGVMLYFKIRRKLHFLAKKELFKNKLLGSILKGLGCISIDRDNIDINATKQALKVLKDNKTLGIFPEGTRNDNDDNFEIKNGVCTFAIKSKAPIVPIYIQKKPRLFVFNRIYIGEPFELSEFYDKKLTKEVLDEAGQIVVDKFNELKEKYEVKRKKKK